MLNQQPRQSTQVSQNQVDSFRLNRHHFSKRASSRLIEPVLSDMVGAQAQVLLAALMSLRARVKEVACEELETKIWKERRLVRAWCMRRTMYLVPSSDLAIFVRGSARRAMREIRWVLSRGVSQQKLDKLLGGVLDLLDQPITQHELASLLEKSLDYRLKYKTGGGGWGNQRKVPWIVVSDLFLPVGYLLHLVGAQDVICSGQNKGSESTFVRADKWIPDWKDVSQERAEKQLLIRYLRAFGPATLADFALWTGMRVSDAKEIWMKEASNITLVDVEGKSSAALLSSDLPELEKREYNHEELVVSLLPYFDSYLLGHKSHRSIVDESNHQKVYRPQGWVSPVVLVNGKALGVWSHVRSKDNQLLELKATLFSKRLVSRRNISSKIREEGADLARFFGCNSVKTIIQ